MGLPWLEHLHLGLSRLHLKLKINNIIMLKIKITLLSIADSLSKVKTDLTKIRSENCQTFYDSHEQTSACRTFSIEYLTKNNYLEAFPLRGSPHEE